MYQLQLVKELPKQSHFFLMQLLYQKNSSIDAAIIAANDLTYAFTHPGPASPTMILGDERTRALQQLSDIFKPILNRKKKLFLPLQYHQFYSLLKLH